MGLKKDSDIDAGTTIALTDEVIALVAVEPSGKANKRFTWQQIKDLFGGGSGGSSLTLQSVTSASTVTPAATDDVVVISAQAAALSIAAPLGTSDGRRTIVFKIKDNGTTRAITWNAAYVWMGTAYANTTVAKWAYITGIYNAVDSKWHLMPAQVQA